MGMVTQAVVLVGGKGTRLGAITATTPKPMVPVAGRPFLEYILDELVAQGFRDILLLTGYLADTIAEQYHDRPWRNAHIRCVREETPLGTGGALAHASAWLDDAFLMMNGDTFFDINLRALCAEGLHYDAPATLALRAVTGDRYGTVAWDGARITSFAARGPGGLINGGIYFMRKSILASLRHGEPASIEADVFPKLAEAGQLRGMKYDAFFIDIGIPEALAEAQHSIPAQVQRPLMLLDRDGVLNVDTGYVHTQTGFQWRRGAKAAVRRLNDARWRIAVVTNQAGVARGYYTERDVQALHHWMNAELAAEGAYIDAFYYCPHHPSEGVLPAYAVACDCRKPAPGMIHAARRDWPGPAAILIGDKATDIAAAQAAGIPGLLLQETDDTDSVVIRAMQALPITHLPEAKCSGV